MLRSHSPVRSVASYGDRWPVTTMSWTDIDYMNEVWERMRWDAMRRRRNFGNTDEVDRSLPQPIEVEAVEFYVKDNAKSHHTENYDLLEGTDASPVLRRGEPFFMAIRFKRPFSIDTDKVKVKLIFGPKNRVGKGTLVILPVTSQKQFTQDASKWDICMSRLETTIVILQIQIPHVAGVGLWRMKIQSKVSGNEKLQTHACKENIYVIFNPWCKEDPVYMQDDIDRQEYVLNDVGKIYVGTYDKPVGRPWVFGQFADAVLPASVFLLEKSGLDYSSRGNPIKVVRAISAMVNSNDDNGVLVGKWYGNYEDGTAPWIWTGSASILEKYLTGGGKPVRYGQCWVFSGICTTVCRALGIPSRSVTNFVSAHDRDDNNLTVDIYFDKDGNPLDEMNEDSVWNFHVWNDCWMARYDMPAGYGGWQVVDATPQERSEGVYRAGPASLVAIRRGEISHLYDAPFIFAEVNADVIYWQKDDSEHGYKKLKTDTKNVGRLIVTKRAGFDHEFGNRDMEDISPMYKSVEGSYEERMTVLNAARRAGMTHIYDMPKQGKEDVSFKLLDIEKVMIGKKFQVIVEVENKSDEKRTVTSVLSASTVHYTGIIARKVKRDMGTFVLKPRQKEELGIEVTVDDYLDKLVEYAMLKIYAISTVKETQQTWSAEDDFQVEKPPLKIEVEGQLKVHRPFNIRITFTNPLKRTLEDCVLTIEGPGLAEPYQIQLSDVGPEETMTHVETLAPRKAGPRKITAVFSSRQLIEVLGSKQVVVEDEN